jgi:hypothetical protein
MARAFSFVLIAFLAAQAVTAQAAAAQTRTDGPVPAAEYELRIEDEVERKRFKVTLLSRAETNLCVSSAEWPDRSGRVQFPRASIYVLANQSVYPIIESESVCVRDCGRIVIKPGAAVDAHLPYSQFGPRMSADPDVHRQLVFQVEPHYCN